MGLLRGLWLLCHYQFWILDGTPPGYPVVLSPGDSAASAALGLQHRPFHVFQQFTDNVDFWIWAWVTAELVNPPALLRPYHQGSIAGTAQTQLPMW